MYVIYYSPLKVFIINVIKILILNCLKYTKSSWTSVVPVYSKLQCTETVTYFCKSKLILTLQVRTCERSSMKTVMKQPAVGHKSIRETFSCTYHCALQGAWWIIPPPPIILYYYIVANCFILIFFFDTTIYYFIIIYLFCYFIFAFCFLISVFTSCYHFNYEICYINNLYYWNKYPSFL